MAMRVSVVEAAVWAAVVSMVFCAAAAGKVVYVDDDAAEGGDGSSWATAYKYLQDGLADALATSGGGGNGGGNQHSLVSNGPPVEIRVAQGVYTPDRSATEPNGTGDRLASFDLFTDLAMVGGYAGMGAPDPNARDPHLHETILSGDLDSDDVAVDDPCDLRNEPTRSENSTNIIEILNVNNVRVDGFTITGGQATIGGRDGVKPTQVGAGLRTEEVADLLIKDCVFVANCAGWGSGGGAIRDSTDVVLDSCTISHNSATHTGGLSVFGSRITVRKCNIIRNYGDNTGGLSMGGTEIDVVDCSIENNVAQWGSGGALLGDGKMSFDRCIIKGPPQQNLWVNCR